MIFFKSEYSFLKSICRISSALKKCSELGIKDVAILDDNLYGALKFYNTAKSYDINPLIGCELKIEGEKITVVCKNNYGLKNLFKLASLDYISEKNFEKFNSGLVTVRHCPICRCVDEDELYLIEILDCLRENRKYKDTKIYKKEFISLENNVNFLNCENCEVSFELGEYHLPKFNLANSGESSENYLKKLAKNGFLKRYGGDASAEYKKRLMYELGIIIQMGFADYFLIVWDYVKFSRENKISVGAGRGSAVGSMVAYCLGITSVDPMRYNLIFERFLNPERVSMPDIDIDFCSLGRPKVVEYVFRKYQGKNVARIITFSEMSEKTLTRDLTDIGINIFKQDVIIEKLKGLPHHSGVHAAGIVITPSATTDFCPTVNHNDFILTQFDMSDIEKIGLVKMDILALQNLTNINETCKIIQFDINTISYDDKNIYNMLGKGDTIGVFQLEGKGVTSFLVKQRPESLDDIILATSINRTGAMYSIPIYLRNKKNPKGIVYKHPLLKPILAETFGCIVYQEQVMEIFRILGGYTYGGADMVRRAMGKKNKEMLGNEQDNFVSGCKKNNISEKLALEIFEDLYKFAKYGFNKSHAAGYSHIAYQTAFLKYYYPEQYFRVLAGNYSEDDDSQQQLSLF